MTRWAPTAAGLAAAGLIGATVLAGCSHHSTQRPPTASFAQRVTDAMRSTNYDFTLSESGTGTATPAAVTGQGRVSGNRMIATFAVSGSTVGVLVTDHGGYVRYPGKNWTAQSNLQVHPPQWAKIFASLHDPQVTRRGIGRPCPAHHDLPPVQFRQRGPGTELGT